MAANFVDKDYPEEKAIIEAVSESIAQREASTEPQIPAGYLPISLSTKGKLGVPPVVYVRNFTTEDLLDLSLSVDSNLPTKTIQTLNRVILDKNVDVANWPEKAVIELLLSIYSNFFTSKISSLPFPWNEEDVQYLKDKGMEEKAIALQTGAWIPKIDIDTKDIEIKDIDTNVKDTISIKKKDGSFEASFLSFPKIGDTLILKSAVDREYAAKDAEWVKFKQRIDLKERLIEEGNIEQAVQITIDPQVYLKYIEYESERALLLIKLTQALYLKSFMGQDLSKVPLVERLKYFEDPRLDITVTKKIEKKYEELEFGVQDKIHIKNPITGKMCDRRFTFRTVDILQAIRQYDSSDYDIGYDD